MSNIINTYPILDEKMFNACKIRDNKFKFLSTNNKKLSVVNVENEKNIYKLESDSILWNLDEYGFIIQNHYVINNIKVLFGPDGIACHDAKIGLALQWSSPTTKVKGIEKIIEFDRRDKNVDVHFQKKFDTGAFLGTIEFKTIMYIAREGIPNYSENSIANDVGLIIGELNQINLMFDGQGSTFPIFEMNFGDDFTRLWDIEINYDDPTFDAFNECFALYINKNHPFYTRLKKDSAKYDKQLFKEILSSAFTILIMQVKESEHWEDITENRDLYEGSLGQAIYYYISALRWQLDTPTNIMNSVNKFCNEVLSI